MRSGIELSQFLRIFLPTLSHVLNEIMCIIYCIYSNFNLQTSSQREDKN